MRILALLFAAIAVAVIFAVSSVDSFALAAPAKLSIAGAMFGTAYLRDALPLGVPLMAAKTVEDLQAEQQALLDASSAIVAKADEEDRDMTEDELAEIEANKVKVEALARQISARQAAAPVAVGAGRRSAPEARGGHAAPGARGVPAAPKDTARHNFLNLGEFAISVRSHALGVENEGVKKLVNAATTYGNEGAGADGGFLVPPDFSTAIWKKVEAEENLMSRCVELTPEGNSMFIPKDETTPWGSSGIRVYWEPEAAAATASKGAFEGSTQRLYKLTALAPASDEMLEDAPGYTSWLMAKVPGLMSHKINTAIVSGTGAGQPLGILNSPSLVSVAKETSQPADTVWMANVNKMWSRMYAPWRRNAVWLINQDVEPSLEGMAFQAMGSSSMLPSAASTPIYMPPGGLSEAPYGRLKGRPVIPLQAAKTVGDQGDIMLVDLQQYFILRKAAGMRSDTSIHLYFDQSVTAFRFVFRINGQPAWSSAISPENGTNTLSWAVALDAR